jgi:hypothetical protein
MKQNAYALNAAPFRLMRAYYCSAQKLGRVVSSVRPDVGTVNAGLKFPKSAD